MDLSKRLQIVANAVTPGNRIADIGTDHGYVPIYLVEKGGCPSGFAMDVNKGPLEKAKTHIRQNGLSDKIETRLSNGLAKLEAGEADSIVIAGMGGDLICKILGAADWLRTDGPELILQPQAESFKVRHWLHNNGYEICKEWFLMEDGKYYVILKAVVTDHPCSFDTEEEYLFGRCLVEEKHPVFIEYLKKEVSKKETVLSKLSGLPNQEARRQEVRKELEQVREILKKME